MPKRVTRLLAFIALIFVSGCTTMQTYPGYGVWDDNVQPLGPVSYCMGGFCDSADEGSQWALALAVPPNADIYYAALRTKASKVYSVPETDIVLSEVKVRLITEAVGTVRGWKADASAGRAAPAGIAKGSSAERLREVHDLHSQSLITAEEHERRRREILDAL